MLRTKKIRGNRFKKREMDGDESNKNPKLQRSAILLLVLVFALVVIGTIVKTRYRRDVKSDHHITYGWIVEYIDSERSSVEGKKRTIIYAYKAGAATFRRKVDTTLKFSECENVKDEECARKRFWVIYSKTDAGKSLINLKIELQEIDNPKFPDTLDGFI
jgi:hypothetical protein